MVKRRRCAPFFYSDEKEPELLDGRQYKKKNESCTEPATLRELGQINGREYQNLTHMTGVMSKKK
jgi:hypothetical protein